MIRLRTRGNVRFTCISQGSKNAKEKAEAIKVTGESHQNMMRLEIW